MPNLQTIPKVKIIVDKCMEIRAIMPSTRQIGHDKDEPSRGETQERCPETIVGLLRPRLPHNLELIPC